MDKILYSPKEGTSGFWGLRDVPEEPNWNLTSLSNDVKKGKYREALESCKFNSLEIVNPTATMLLGQYKSGDIFDLPEGYEFKEEEKSDGWMSLTKVFRLVKTETKEVFQPGDRIDLSTGYVCDRGKFLRYEDGLVVWESDLGGVYRSSTDTYKIKVLSRANPELFSQPETEESQEKLITELIGMIKSSDYRYALNYFTIQRKKQ